MIPEKHILQPGDIVQQENYTDRSFLLLNEFQDGIDTAWRMLTIPSLHKDVYNTGYLRKYFILVDEWKP